MTTPEPRLLQKLGGSPWEIEPYLHAGGYEAWTKCVKGLDREGVVNELKRSGLRGRGGWDRDWAEQHFLHFSPMFEIGNEVDFVLSEAKRLRLRYPKILVAPLLYRVEDNRLYHLREGTL